MTLSVTIRGNYYSSGSISFSSLRSNFRAQNLDGTFNTDDEQISASELKRVTDVSNSNPIVPDAYENSSIASSNDLKLSQFRGSVKYYLLDQTDVNDNSGDNTSPGLNLTTVSGVSNWNNNLSKNIIKSIGIAGTVGSYYPNQPAISIDNDTSNVIINVSGEVYGGGGQYNVNSGLGGTAIYVNNSLPSYTKVNVISDGLIWAGGGAGGRGGRGGTGGTGGTGGSYPLYKRTPGTGGRGGDGGIGGNGRGYGQNISIGIGGEGGLPGTTGNTLFGSGAEGKGVGDYIEFRYQQLDTRNNIRYFTAGDGGTGGTGGIGGYGGDWGTDGDDGFDGDPGPRGGSSNTALFYILPSRAYVTYSGSYGASNVSRFYIYAMLDIARGGGTSTYNGVLGIRDDGIYGPIESYDTTYRNVANGINRFRSASMYADDLGGAGDDKDDLVLHLSHGTVEFLSFLGEVGPEGEEGEKGKLRGYAVGGENVTLISRNVNADTVKGRYVSLTYS